MSWRQVYAMHQAQSSAAEPSQDPRNIPPPGQNREAGTSNITDLSLCQSSGPNNSVDFPSEGSHKGLGSQPSPGGKSVSFQVPGGMKRVLGVPGMFHPPGSSELRRGMSEEMEMEGERVRPPSRSSTSLSDILGNKKPSATFDRLESRWSLLSLFFFFLSLYIYISLLSLFLSLSLSLSLSLFPSLSLSLSLSMMQNSICLLVRKKFN